MMMDSISKAIYSLLFISAAILTGCNTSYNSVLKNPNNLNYPDANKIIPTLPVYFDIESLNNTTMGWGGDADGQRAEIEMYKPQVYGHLIEIANNDLRKNVFSPKTPKRYNGHIRVKLASNKISGHYAMLATSILFVPMMCGAPLCHSGYECHFVFDVCDNYGNVIKSYPIKTYTRKYLGLYTMAGDVSFRSPMAVNFRSAMKQFDAHLMNDRHLIISALKEANDKVEKSRATAMDLMEQKGVKAFADHIKYMDENSKKLQDKLDKVIADDPRDVYARMFRAFTRADNQNYTGALSDISAYADVNPSCPSSHPYAYKSTLLNMLNRNLESLIAADKAVFYDGNSADSWLALGRAYNKMGLLDKGVPALKRALEIDPNMIAVYDEIRQCEEISSRQAADLRAYENYRQQQVAMAMANLSNSISNSMTTLGNLVAPTPSAASNLRGAGKTRQSNSSSGGTERVECSNCHGKGTVSGTSTVSFSSSHTYYCDECHRDVPSSHSHDRCSSCMGKGYVIRIKR